MREPTPETEVEIPLAEMIETLRRELATAREEGRGKDLQFTVGDAQLELQIVVSRQKAAEGGLRISVVSIGGRTQSERAATHTLKLTLRPAGDLEVGDTLEGHPE